MDNFNGKNPADRSVNARNLHIVMFPWLARGHIAPFMELSKRLATKSINITFVSTPRNIAEIRPSFAEHQETINLVQLELPSVEGLPPGIESTAHLPPHLITLFHSAARGLEKSLEILLAKIKPDFVIFDHVLYWTPKVALRLQIPAIVFDTPGAAYTGYHFCPARRSAEKITVDDLCEPPAGYPSAIRYRLHETRSIIALYTEFVEIGVKPIDCMVDCYDECSAIVIKSCCELEGKFIDYIREVTMRPVFPIGPLLPRPYPVRNLEGLVADEENGYCLRWLEKQRACSVVFVCFGSEYFLSREEIEEIALGLEASGQPFLWVVRFPCEESLQEEMVLGCLPQGFLGRIGGRGLVLSGWGPQREILCHSSTGAFLSHCGWSSIMEGMAAGLPLIALPMQLDQGLNARLVVEDLEVGVEVERGSDGCVRRGDVYRAVRTVLVEEEGRRVRDRAAGMRDLFRDKIVGNDEGSVGSEMQCIDDLVRLLHG